VSTGNYNIDILIHSKDYNVQLDKIGYNFLERYSEKLSKHDKKKKFFILPIRVFCGWLAPVYLFLNLIGPSLLLAQNMEWTCAIPSAGWSARWGHTSVFFNDKIWVLGGYDSGSLKNDVWFSPDGVEWMPATASAGWSQRYGHTSVVFDNKIWVLGGCDGSRFKNDVWFSSDGIHWSQATASAGWTARWGHTSVVFDNKIWVMGGFDGGYYQDKNDVWYSLDGINWICMTDSAGWSRREEHSSVVFDNKLWVMGGGWTNNDVWFSTDGAIWFQVTDSAGWSIRRSQTSVVFDNKIWVLGGGIVSPNNDVWYSNNGMDWTQTTASSIWQARSEHASVVFNDRIWVLGGELPYRNDVWYARGLINDVGVTQIIAPSGTIDSGTVVTPRVVVRNFGAFPETFSVRFKVSPLYANTQTVTNLNSGDSIIVDFVPWTALQRDTHITKCTTALSADSNPANNVLNGSFIVRVVDVGASSILAPVDTIDLGTVVIPKAVIQNFGTVARAFPVKFSIGTFYEDTNLITLAARRIDTVEFEPWIAFQAGTYTTRCSTLLSDDMNPTNNFVRDSVTVGYTGESYIIYLRHTIDDVAGGNGDGIVNPGETINMPLWVKNYGDSTGRSINGYFRINNSNITIIDSVKYFGDLPPLDSSFTGDTGFKFTVSTACTNGYNLRFSLACFDINDSVGNSNVLIVVGVPVLGYDGKIVDDSGAARPNGNVDPGETARLIVILSNQGLGNAYNVSAILRSGDSRLTIDDSIGNVGTILADSLGNNNADRFTVTATHSIPLETQIPCTLHITADGNYRATIPFTIMVGTITIVDPIPDGPRIPPLYYAYDNVDTSYLDHPHYKWFEINTIGTRLPLGDDQTVQVTLPPAFGIWKFYEQRYSQISICSNGWIAPGNQTPTAYLNQRLPDPTSNNPNGMVCANWDDLLPNNSGIGGVYYYYDSLNHRFIIEYDSVPYYGASSIMDKYQIIIYDTTRAAADEQNEIVVQYMTTSRWISSTVGIENPINTIAIGCLYNDTLHRGCAPWTTGKVIKYTTDPPVQVGIAQEPSQVFNDIANNLHAYPSPFHNTIQIQFQVRQDGPITLSVYDISGRLVRNLLSGNLKSGNYVVRWDGYDDKKIKVAKGIYFYRLETCGFTTTKKAVKME
jgi:hypothetical protein